MHANTRIDNKSSNMTVCVCVYAHLSSLSHTKLPNVELFTRAEDIALNLHHAVC